MEFEEVFKNRPEYKWNDWDEDSPEWHYELMKYAFEAGQAAQKEKDARIAVSAGGTAPRGYVWPSDTPLRIAKAIREQE